MLSCSGLSTPTAVTTRPRASAIATTAATRAETCGSLPRPSMNAHEDALGDLQADTARLNTALHERLCDHVDDPGGDDLAHREIDPPPSSTGWSAATPPAVRTPARGPR